MRPGGKPKVLMQFPVDGPDGSSNSPSSWHRLFAPLPADAVVRRQPVAPPEILARPEGASIAGWEQLTVELSAGPPGLRMLLVVIDASGRAISASDMVLYRSETAGADGPLIEFRQENVGGRLEADGTFRGTRWLTLTTETVDGQELKSESTPSEPGASDVTALKALVLEIMQRASPG